MGGWLYWWAVFSRLFLDNRSRCHFSVTAAAIGVRMVPRAVAASSSISAFSRRITHSIASRPWSKTKHKALVYMGELSSSNPVTYKDWRNCVCHYSCCIPNKYGLFSTFMKTSWNRCSTPLHLPLSVCVMWFKLVTGPLLTFFVLKKTSSGSMLCHM